MANAQPVPAPAPPGGPLPDPTVDIYLDNLANNDPITCTFRVTGRAVSRDGNNIASVSRQINIGFVAPLADTSSPTGSSPFNFEFDITAAECALGEHTLTIRAVKDAVTYFLTVIVDGTPQEFLSFSRSA